MRSGRPTAGTSENPFRFQHLLQYQVILEPGRRTCSTLDFGPFSPPSASTSSATTLRLVEDDWRSSLSIGAWGSAGRSACDGMEITQFTYFQQVGRHRGSIPTPGGSRRASRARDDSFQVSRRTFERTGPPGSPGRRLPRERAAVVREDFEEAPVDVLARRFAEHRGRSRASGPPSAPAAASHQRPGGLASHSSTCSSARGGAVPATERAATTSLRARSLTLKVALFSVGDAHADAAALR